MRKLFTALLALLVPVLLCRVSAAELPDPERLGSLTISMEFDGEPLEGGSLTLCRAGEIAPDGKSFLLVEALRSEGTSLDDLWDPDLAGELNRLATQHGLEFRTAAIENGRAVFSGLEPGLYVVSQRTGEETPGFAAVDPFLMSLPQWQDGTYIYDLTASPKVPLEPESTETTDPTSPTQPDDDPDLPQTGQLNWPIPLMAVLGMAFLGLGWSLLFGSKRRKQ